MLTRYQIVTFALLLSVKSLQAIELPDGFVDEPYLTGLDGQITGFDATAAERVYISEKSGVVRVVRDGELLAEPFLDISDVVNDRVDRGLLSVAVHPDFPTTPYLYVLYTFDPPQLVSDGLTGPGVPDGNGNRVSRLVRYTADASHDFNVAVADSEKVILGQSSTYENIGNPEERFDTLTPSCGHVGNPVRDCLPVDEDSHTIGAMRFAEDGSLYVSNGDGASYRTFRSMTQMTYDLDSLRGKILRLNPETGEGLPDNPYYDGDAGSNRSRVLSVGLRNPYSMTIHPLTSEPYVGDVGEELWEEINGGIARNFGWPCYEGGRDANERQTGFEVFDFCQTLYESSELIEAPLLSWEHEETGSSAMVGDFYFGEEFPAEYSGKLFYGDFIQGWMRVADVSDPANVSSSAFATDMLPMTEIRLGVDGAIYYASISSGEIRRIRYAGSAGGSDGGTDTGGDSGGDTPGDSPQAVRVGTLSSWYLALLLSAWSLRQCLSWPANRKRLVS